MKSKTEETAISDEFSLKPATQAWLQREYPQLDEARTVEAFIEWAQNQRDNNKRSKTYGELMKCFNWQAKFKNVVRIQITNKWTTIAIPKQGQEVDVRWAEILTHAKAIGCPLQRRPNEPADAFTTRVRMWEVHDKPSNNTIDFSAALKAMK